MPNSERLINKQTKEEVSVVGPSAGGKVLVQRHPSGLLEVIDEQLLEQSVGR